MAISKQNKQRVVSALRVLACSSADLCERLVAFHMALGIPQEQSQKQLLGLSAAQAVDLAKQQYDRVMYSLLDDDPPLNFKGLISSL